MSDHDQTSHRLRPDARRQCLIYNAFACVFSTDKPMPADIYRPGHGDRMQSEMEEWILYDSWGIDLACKLITIGLPIELDDCRAEEIKQWANGEEEIGNFETMRSVYERAFNIADASVKAGTLKDPDTPANWLAWAQRKGYSVSHLLPDATSGTTEGAAPPATKKPLPAQRFQEQEILRVIRELGHEPAKLPKREHGIKGVKSEVRGILTLTTKVFDLAWERLRAGEEIQEEQ